MKLKTVDHIGMVVKDLEAAKAFCSSQLGLGPWGDWEIPGIGGLKGTLARVDGVGLQLLEPLTKESFHSEFLNTQGAGLHHFCVLVDDVDAATEALVDQGAKVLFWHKASEFEPMLRESNVEIPGLGIILELREQPA